MQIIHLAASAAVALLCASNAAAQVTPQPEAAAIVAVPAAAVTTGSFLPTNTEVMLRINSELSSKKAKEGTAFTLTVASDVMMGNNIIIPRGTPAYGEVTWRTGKGAFGKSAKMDVEMRYIDLGGRRIPLSGKFRQEGKGNTGAAVGAAVAVGVFGAFVTGKSAVIEQGREFKVYTTEPVPVVIPPAATAPVPIPAPTTAAITNMR